MATFATVSSFVNLNATGILCNIFLLQDLTHTESAIAPLWSLPYEMHRYLILLLIYLLAKKWRSALPLALLWILAFIAGSGSHYVEKLVSRTGSFLPLASWLAPSPTKPHLFVVSICPRRFGPIALALITLFYLRHDTTARSWWTCLALGLPLPQFREISTPVFRDIFKHIARYSYSVYLTHFFFIWLAFEQLHRHSLGLRWFAFLVSTIAVSALLYHYVEEPMIGLGHRLSNQLPERRNVPVITPAD